MIISKNAFNLDLRTITRTGHNFNLSTSVSSSTLTTSQNFMCCSSSHFVYHSSLCVSLCLSHDIFILHHTHTKQKSLISSTQPSLSLSLSMMMMTVSLLFFIVLRFFFLLIDTNEMKKCVYM